MAKGRKKCSRSIPKRLGGNATESVGGIHRDLEWVKSTCTQESLEGMVIEATLLDQVTEDGAPPQVRRS